MPTMTAHTAQDMRDPNAHTCAVVKTCTVRAATTAHLAHHVIVWACARHGDTEA